jgi:dsRNA-specific ribonuclease
MTEEKQKYDDDLIKVDSGFVCNPYNPLNIKITLDDIQSILCKYNVPPVVRNLKLFQRAFVHSSYTKRPQYANASQNVTMAPMPKDCLPLSSKSNERLEFIGDGILEGITKLYLYKRFPKNNEGFMTDKKIDIVKNESIGKIAYEMGLHKWLIISKRSEEKNLRNNFKKLGCLFEAFLGALFLNFETHNPEASDACHNESPGFKMATKFVTSIFETHIDWVSLILTNDNHKSTLQFKLQKEFYVTPHHLTIVDDFNGYNMGVYLCIGQPIHAVHVSESIPLSKIKTFQAIHDHIAEHGKILVCLGEGLHKTKRKAEQIASFNALKLINEFN